MKLIKEQHSPLFFQFEEHLNKMKNLFIQIIVVLCGAQLVAAQPKPIEYHVQSTYHRMMIVLRSDVHWQEKKSNDKMEILIFPSKGNPFIVQNIGYKFNDGIIKTFTMQSEDNGSKRILIQFRRPVNDYKIYQQEKTKYLFIEFYPNEAATAASMHHGKAQLSQRVESSTKRDVINSPRRINIPQIALQQIEGNSGVQPQNDRPAVSTSMESATLQPIQESHAGMWLLILSILILIGGTSAFIIVLIKKNKITRSTQSYNTASFVEKNNEIENVETHVPSLQTKNLVVDESEEEFSHAIEYAEEYLRSLGELDLAARLEKLTQTTTKKKYLNIPSSVSKKKNKRDATAKKLGLSVGEIDLATRLKQFSSHNSVELS